MTTKKKEEHLCSVFVLLVCFVLHCKCGFIMVGIFFFFLSTLYGDIILLAFVSFSSTHIYQHNHVVVFTVTCRDLTLLTLLKRDDNNNKNNA